MKKIMLSKSKIHGKGIFAREKIEKGERIAYITGRYVKKIPRSRKESNSIRTWFGIGNHWWINPHGTIYTYLNHSCNPNAAIIGKKTLVAIATIRKGQEISVDYSMTDVDPYFRLNCKCGTKQCRKLIGNIFTIPKPFFKKHMPYISPYFKKKYLENGRQY